MREMSECLSGLADPRPTRLLERLAGQNLPALDKVPSSPYAGSIMCTWSVCARETELCVDLYVLIVGKLCGRG